MTPTIAALGTMVSIVRDAGLSILDWIPTGGNEAGELDGFILERSEKL